ncbi:c-type cytochrome [Pseudooceanicola algae]|uniref:Uncharacterized protein n=1 Tax=Pseudooceanicola algae TaxID=1537215 RepID=A0A418SGR7_9RHOB|nr:cytochrome c [Pseudooceanicola algae]QPM91778.1 hypothetical protein PSAL_030330 [Pseudooceanicola algae]
MNRKLLTISTAAAVLAGAALAHSEVQNEDVKARMDLMKDLRDNFGALAGMAQGKTDFDADVAQASQLAVIGIAGKIPSTFEAEAMDPESEASPDIWTNWSDFVANAEALEVAAEGLDPSSLDTLKAGFGSVAGTCGTCHKAFRVK